MLKIYEVDQLEQGTEEWHVLKDHYFLSSSKAQAIGNAGAGLSSIIWDNIINEFSSADRKRISTPDLDRGIDLEPKAIADYELETGNDVKAVAFITNHDIHPRAGASTDGLIGDDGVLEVKSIKDEKYAKLLYEYEKKGTFKIESAHSWQMEFELLLSGREWVDYVVYNPNFKKTLLIQRVYSDPVMRDKIMTGLHKGAKEHKEIRDTLIKYKHND